MHNKHKGRLSTLYIYLQLTQSSLWSHSQHPPQHRRSPFPYPTSGKWDGIQLYYTRVLFSGPMQRLEHGSSRLMLLCTMDFNFQRKSLTSVRSPSEGSSTVYIPPPGSQTHLTSNKTSWDVIPHEVLTTHCSITLSGTFWNIKGSLRFLNRHLLTSAHLPNFWGLRVYSRWLLHSLHHEDNRKWKVRYSLIWIFNALRHIPKHHFLSNISKGHSRPPTASHIRCHWTTYSCHCCQ